ncbi:MAG: transposase [Candidatus Marinimicrobia bacterium]|nr:transposase [Candidatus Neomarinimicrobiota bacterium]
MTTLADIFQLHGAEYLAQYGNSMSTHQKKAIRDILTCRTPHLGGHTWFCEHCRQFHYSYHSCKNRSCPQCQNDQAENWLNHQSDNLMPVEYFLATFTIPEDLKILFRKYPRLSYHQLFHSSTDSLKKLALDKRFIGGKIGMIGVLHTWTRQLTFHPHIHFIIPGIALSEQNQKIRFSKEGFLVRVELLSMIFKAKFRDAVMKNDLEHLVPNHVWRQDWVVHLKSVGNGQAALTYLAPYLYRIAISNANILKCTDRSVTFRYKDSSSGQTKLLTLPALEFIRRYLHHVLPKGFQKVRYFGFLHPKNKTLLNTLRLLLHCNIYSDKTKGAQPFVFKCPDCGREMILIDKTIRQRAPPLSVLLTEYRKVSIAC